MARPRFSFCQSCSFPICSESDFGTHANGRKHPDFCKECFNGGEFVHPNISVSEMIERVSAIMVERMSVQYSEAAYAASVTIPMLKRWRGGKISLRKKAKAKRRKK